MSAYAWTAHSRAVHSRSASRYAARSPVQEKQTRRSRARCTTCSVPWASSGQARRGIAHRTTPRAAAALTLLRIKSGVALGVAAERLARVRQRLANHDRHALGGRAGREEGDVPTVAVKQEHERHVIDEIDARSRRAHFLEVDLVRCGHATNLLLAAAQRDKTGMKRGRVVAQDLAR